MTFLFTTTIFLSALLLFLIQPMFARMILPRFGGAPAVWNTAMVCYQLLLLAGYLYAHLATSWLGARRQSALHVLVLLAPLPLLPIALPQGWAPPGGENPTPWLLALLLVAVGGPFFVISSSSPLLQTWFAQTRHRAAADPYFLYAASNTGSMLALLGYPLLIEPRLTLAEQSRWWAFGYGLLALLILSCAIAMWRSGSATRSQLPTPAPAGLSAAQPAEPTLRRRLRWLVLALVPSSMMLSVTTYLSTDISPFPLLWVIPLAIYLLSFILAFASRPPIPHWLMVRALPVVLLPLLLLMIFHVQEPFWLPLLGHLLLLFVVAMVCHGQLAADRPGAQELTRFYLWLSFGGMLGGLLNGLLAPLIFNEILEYPLGIVLACLLLPQRRAAQWPRRRGLDLILPLALGATIFGLNSVLGALNLKYSLLGIGLLLIAPVVVCASLLRRPTALGLSVGVVLLLSGSIYRQDVWQDLTSVRNFFGVTRVVANGSYHALFHGKVIHGLQDRNPGQRRTPRSYYHPQGPLGQLMDHFGTRQAAQYVAGVGLGAGTAACYKQPGQQWTFYEIDPDVVRIARDPRYFSYLQDCAPEVEIVLGDARLSLTQAPPQHYDLIILDAYSSDAIPVHLLTREALALYLEKLAPEGVLAFHVTNRHLQLEPVLAALAHDAGLAGVIRQDPVPAQEVPGLVRSDWAVLARDEAQLVSLLQDERWRPLQRRDGTAAWSDDFSNVLSVLRWHW